MTAAEGYSIPDEAGFTPAGYEYNIQYRWLEPGIHDRNTTEWHYSFTNKFSSEAWYPNSKSVKNALAQLRTPRWGQKLNREFRVVRRPYGEVEILG